MTNVISKISNIITHDGKFHADEVVGIAIIKNLVPWVRCTRSRETLEVLMSKDNRIREDNVIFIDVGGGDFDHHQKGGNGIRENGVPYASAGLVWKTYGELLIKDMFPKLEEVLVDKVFSAVDEKFIQPIDAIDTGTAMQITGFSFSSTVSVLNETDGFDFAVKMAEEVLYAVITKESSQQTAKADVLGAIAAQRGSDDYPEILVLTNQLPWIETVLGDPLGDGILFVVFPDTTNGWRVQTVPKELGKFGARKDLPKEWGGLSQDCLLQVTGVEDAVFCHQGLFICGALTVEGAMRLAELAVAA